MRTRPTVKIKGILPPMITPLTSNGEIDIKSTEKLINHLVGGGVQGIFILGTTGEAASLSIQKKLDFIDAVLNIVADRIPVLVGITDSSEEVSLELARKAYSAGAYAVVSAPPFYYDLGQAELINYYKSLASKSPLPIFLYNMPSNTKIHFKISTVMELSKHANIIGLKDSSGDSKYFQNLIYNLREHLDFLLYVGPEELLAETVLMGGSGGICGGANLFPELYTHLYNCSVEKRHTEVIELQSLVMEISNNLYTIGKHQSSYLKGLKCSLHILGICENNLASPLQSFEKEEYKKVEGKLTVIKDKIEKRFQRGKLDN